MSDPRNTTTQPSTGAQSSTGVQTAATRDATAATQQANTAVLQELPFNNTDDFEDAKRGFVATLADGKIAGETRPVIWDLTAYKFLDAPTAPATVNPSLWRQAQLNYINGLFKVTDRIYQIRGFDLSNMTIIEGDTGIIIIDPMISTECARAGLNLYYEKCGQKPVKAVIYTHSHIDHFGGVKGVVSEEDVKAGKVPILAPSGFLEHAVSENVYAGNAMSRRALYMYGALLPKSERGQVDGGLGKTTSLGTVTLIPPTDTVKETGETRTIDGVEMMFMMAYETEAPSEMLFYFPQFHALCAAEDMTHNLHNLYTLRGAEVRNAAAWWKTINLAIELFGDKIDIVFAQHHWPMWGKERIQTFFAKQRDMYKYLHDQSLRLMNHGYTMLEVAEAIKLPDSLAHEWYNRGYYGTVNHDAKAVYQKYLGFYSSNPSELHPLPPEDAAKKYVEFMGGADAIMAKARESFNKAEYRWVAQVLNHVVFADPNNQQAKNMLADTLEQLGYQAENSTWRNEYLMGAFELRNGLPNMEGLSTGSPDVIKAMTLDMFFDFMGVRLNGPKADGKTILLNWVFTDTGDKYTLRLENCALSYTAKVQHPKPDATLTLTRATLDDVNSQKMTMDQALSSGAIKIDGDSQKVTELFGLLDTFNPMFNIVTP